MNRLLVTLVLALTALVGAPQSVSAEDLAHIKLAAEAGDPAAQTKLAERTPDAAEADQWFRKAAAQGYAPAQGKLGSRLLLRCTLSPSRDSSARADQEQEALKWLQLGAQQGDTLSQGKLAKVYLEGKWVTQDLVASYKWGTLSRRGPMAMLNEGAIIGGSARSEAILKMTPAQIKAADQQVAAFRPSKPAAAQAASAALPAGLKLKGITLNSKQRFALISGKTFTVGETGKLQLGQQTLTVHCVEIQPKSVRITLDDEPTIHELKLR